MLSSWFQSEIVRGKKEFAYTDDLLLIVVKQLSFNCWCFSTKFLVSQFLNVFALIFLLCLTGVRYSVGGIAGTSPLEILYMKQRRFSFRRDSSVGRFKSVNILVIDPGCLEW